MNEMARAVEAQKMQSTVGNLMAAGEGAAPQPVMNYGGFPKWGSAGWKPGRLELAVLTKHASSAREMEKEALAPLLAGAGRLLAGGAGGLLKGLKGVGGAAKGLARGAGKARPPMAPSVRAKMGLPGPKTPLGLQRPPPGAVQAPTPSAPVGKAVKAGPALKAPEVSAFSPSAIPTPMAVPQRGLVGRVRGRLQQRALPKPPPGAARAAPAAGKALPPPGAPSTAPGALPSFARAGDVRGAQGAVGAGQFTKGNVRGAKRQVTAPWKAKVQAPGAVGPAAPAAAAKTAPGAVKPAATATRRTDRSPRCRPQAGALRRPAPRFRAADGG